MLVREATVADLPQIKAIYDEQVLTGTATFDVVPPPLDYWERRLASEERGDHVLVVLSGHDEQVLGYAYSTSYRPRPAYDRTRETSVYLTGGLGGRGLGRALYDALLLRLRHDEIHTVVAVIATPNPASEALHRASGFEQVGLLPEVGRKFDRWLDTAFWALLLDA